MFNRLKKLYMADRLTKAGLENAVLKGWITEEQKAAIIAEKSGQRRKTEWRAGRTAGRINSGAAMQKAERTACGIWKNARKKPALHTGSAEIVKTTTFRPDRSRVKYVLA